MKVTEQDYKKYVRISNRKFSSLPIGASNIVGIRHISNNINYLDWGNTSSVMDSKTTVIRDVNIDSSISEIIVNRVNRFVNEITVKYQFDAIKSFTDFIGKNYIRRTLSKGKKIFINLTQQPIFSYESF